MEKDDPTYKIFILKKLWPVLVSLGGAAVMILAFFIPSLQEQWDRYQSRKVIEQYEEIGNEFYNEEHYKMAEEAYARAFELSDQMRLDIEVKRLSARVHRVNEDPTWGSNPPEDLQEADFQLLLHMQKGKDKARERLYTLNSYGIFLAGQGRLKESRAAFDEAIQQDTSEAYSYINLGDLLDQEQKYGEAEKVYLKAIALDSNNVRVHYNLGLLFLELQNPEKAAAEFGKVIKLDPADSDAVYEIKRLQK